MHPVTICIPTYNQVAYLKPLLQGIATQSLQAQAVIISDDSTTTAVKKLTDQYNNLPIAYHHNSPSCGTPANWNNALQLATTPWVKLMHHDDAFTQTNSLEIMVTAVTNAKADYAFCDTIIINANKNTSKVHTINNLQRCINKPWRLYFGNEIGAPSTLITNHTIALQLPYCINYKWLVDCVYYYQLFTQNKNGVHVKQALISTTDGATHQVTTSCISNYPLILQEQQQFAILINAPKNSLLHKIMQLHLTITKLQIRHQQADGLRKHLLFTGIIMLRRCVKLYLRLT